MRRWWAGCSLLCCCWEHRVGRAVTPLQLCSVGGRGPVAAFTPEGISMWAAAGDAGEAAACQLHSSALERGDFCCVAGVSKKAGMWQKRAAKSLTSSLPAACSLKTSWRLQQGTRPVSGCRRYQTKTGMGSVKIGYLFTLFALLFLFPLLQMWVGLQRKGWEFPTVLLLSQYKNKDWERVWRKGKRQEPNLVQISMLVLIFLRSMCWFLTLQRHLWTTVKRAVFCGAGCTFSWSEVQTCTLASQ